MILSVFSPRLGAFLFFVIFLKQIVWGAFQNIAKRLHILKFDAVCLVVDHFVEILIAKTQLNIKPVFRFALLFEYFQDAELHYITSTLYYVKIIYRKPLDK